MKNSSEEQEWQELAPSMHEELARIRADQELIVETRNRFLNGKATKEQMFLALNAASTNMVIFRGVYETQIRVVVGCHKINQRCEKVEKTASRRENRKVTRHPVVSPVAATNIVPFSKNGRKGVRI